MKVISKCDTFGTWVVKTYNMGFTMLNNIQNRSSKSFERYTGFDQMRLIGAI
jgi:hypothetical protein